MGLTIVTHLGPGIDRSYNCFSLRELTIPRHHAFLLPLTPITHLPTHPHSPPHHFTNPPLYCFPLFPIYISVYYHFPHTLLPPFKFPSYPLYPASIAPYFFFLSCPLGWANMGRMQSDFRPPAAVRCHRSWDLLHSRRYSIAQCYKIISCPSTKTIIGAKFDN